MLIQVFGAIAAASALQSQPNFLDDYERAAKIWAECTRAKASSYASQAESAGTVVDAAFGACSDAETAVRTAGEAYWLFLNSGKGLPVAQVQKDANLDIDSGKTRYREVLVTLVIELRAKK